MIRLLKYIVVFLVVLSLNSCVCTKTYKYDYGKQAKYRYMMLEEKQFMLDLDIYSNNRIVINYYIYPYSSMIEDTISRVRFIKEELKFPDGTVLIKKSHRDRFYKCIDKDGKLAPCIDYYYTCDNIKKKIRKNKYIFLKLVYDIDSLGTIKHYDKEYKFVKKRYCRVGLH